MRMKRMDGETAEFYQHCVDALRITGVSETGLGRIIANDPCLLHDIRAYRNLRPDTVGRYQSRLDEFVAECLLPDGELLGEDPYAPENQDDAGDPRELPDESEART